MKEMIPLMIFQAVVLTIFFLVFSRKLKKIRRREAERLRAHLAELKSDAELAEREGNKLEAARFQREIFKLTEQFKDNLLAIPEVAS